MTAVKIPLFIGDISTNLLFRVKAIVRSDADYVCVVIGKGGAVELYTYSHRLLPKVI